MTNNDMEDDSNDPTSVFYRPDAETMALFQAAIGRHAASEAKRVTFYGSRGRVEVTRLTKTPR